MTLLWTTIGVAILLLLLWGLRRAQQKNAFIWLPAYLKGDWAGRRARLHDAARGTVHIMFCIADHFEPRVGGPELETERERVAEWVEEYPEIAEEFRDTDGFHPRHTFFFPAEEYRPEHLDALRSLVEAGLGEVEIHLHHDNDTPEGFRQKLEEFILRMGSHGLLGSDRPTGDPRFGFVHGNWALDNSRPDGRWCGVNDELRVLRDCGCFADFTLPSAPSPCQTRRINSIYYATDDPERPKSHDDGVEVEVGGEQAGDLMLIQGPLTVRWPGGRFWVLPRLENGDLQGHNMPTAKRMASWVHTNICVAGRPEWVFVKVHTHGCSDRNRHALLGEEMRDFHRHLTGHYNDGIRYRLHYVTARELYNIVKAAEAGRTGDPGMYRDYAILPPAAGPRRRQPQTTAQTAEAGL